MLKNLETLLTHIWVVIVAGGNGTRLFPISTPSREKQFCLLGDKHSFLQKTILNFLSLGIDASHIVVVVSNEHQVDLAREDSTAVGIPMENIWNIGEGHGFYGAMALVGSQIGTIDEHAILINAPADHYLKINEIFADVIEDAIKGALKGYAVLLGVKSYRLATVMSCGNIIYQESADCCFPIRKFIEKPDEDTAKKLLKYSHAVCNTGISVWHVQTLQRFAPKKIHGLKAEEFMGLFKGKLKVVVGNYPWQDCGTFRGLYEALGKTGNRRNAIMGKGEIHTSNKISRSFLYAAEDLALVIDNDVARIYDAACVVAGAESKLMVLISGLDDSQIVSKLANHYSEFEDLLTNNFLLGVNHVDIDIDDGINAAIGIVRFDYLKVRVYKDQNNGDKITVRISKRK